MHGSNGQGLGNFNPSYEGNLLEISFVKYFNCKSKHNQTTSP